MVKFKGEIYHYYHLKSKIIDDCHKYISVYISKDFNIKVGDVIKYQHQDEEEKNWEVIRAFEAGFIILSRDNKDES